MIRTVSREPEYVEEFTEEIVEKKDNTELNALLGLYGEVEDLISVCKWTQEISNILLNRTKNIQHQIAEVLYQNHGEEIDRLSQLLKSREEASEASEIPFEEKIESELGKSSECNLEASERQYTTGVTIDNSEELDDHERYQAWRQERERLVNLYCGLGSSFDEAIKQVDTVLPPFTPKSSVGNATPEEISEGRIQVETTTTVEEKSPQEVFCDVIFEENENDELNKAVKISREDLQNRPQILNYFEQIMLNFVEKCGFSEFRGGVFLNVFRAGFSKVYRNYLKVSHESGSDGVMTGVMVGHGCQYRYSFQVKNSKMSFDQQILSKGLAERIYFRNIMSVLRTFGPREVSEIMIALDAPRGLKMSDASRGFNYTGQTDISDSRAFVTAKVLRLSQEEMNTDAYHLLLEDDDSIASGLVIDDIFIHSVDENGEERKINIADIQADELSVPSLFLAACLDDQQYL